MASTAKVDGIHMPFNWLSLLYYSRVTVNTPPIPRQSAHLICAPVADTSVQNVGISAAFDMRVV